MKNNFNPEIIEYKNNNFPEGTIYEKELNSNFKYFNIFWYDPNKSNDFDCFKKCFENVQFYKAYDLQHILNFFKKESSFEWIVITTGNKGEELIKNLEQYECIKSFFIYCFNTKLHEKWAKNYKKIGCLTSNPEILCQKFIELNKNYLIPNFKYNDDEKNDILLNLKMYSDNKFALNSVKREIKLLIESTNSKKKRYINFCIKTLHYLNGDKYENDFKESPKDENSPFYLYAKLFKTNDKYYFQQMIKNIKNLTLLSLYFTQYQNLFNLLTYNEVKDLLKPKITINHYQKRENKMFFIAEKLVQKLLKNESILQEKKELKEIQIYSLLFVNYRLIESNKNMIKLFNFYQIINFFRDFDFCLKLLLLNIYSNFNNKNHNFIDEIYSSLIASEIRYLIYGSYLCQVTDNNIENLTEEQQNKLNDSLTIKDYLIVGDDKFQEKIKIIEKNIKAKSLKYLCIEQIFNYIKEKNEKDKNLILTYFYYLIIKFEEFKKNLDKILILSAEFGITFVVFLFIENENNYITFHKNIINDKISIILVYSPEDIIKYLSEKLNYIFSSNESEILNDLHGKIPKISFEQNEEEKYQNGCFELAETFDINLIKKKYIINYLDEFDYTEICDNIYNIYKDHNALDLFYEQNSIYFGFELNCEIFYLDICFIKRILYMYCREEIESNKSFYRMINDDLRTRNPSKIYRVINLLALINKLIEEEELASFKGKVFRATKLDEKLIDKLVPGTVMVNTTFWSTSKDFNIADTFMYDDKWRNSFIICETNKNNIDIDFEKLNSFEEKEVLFLPFTEFRVEKVSFENKYQKKIFIIELSELGNKNFVNYDNMQVENVNVFAFMKYGENFFMKNKK